MPTPMYLLNHHHHSHYHQHIITFPHQGPPRQESEGDIGSARQGRALRQGGDGGGAPEIHFPEHIS